MFGGLAFLIDGAIAVSASSGAACCCASIRRRPNPLLRRHTSGASRCGREMDGWLQVEAEAVDTEAGLRRWVTHGVSYARSLARP